MSQFPRLGFSPRNNQKAFNNRFGQRFRIRLALSLAALLFCAPLSFRAAAQQPTANSSSTSDGDFYMIYRNALGDAVCREATADERRELRRIDTTYLGMHPINHVKGELDFPEMNPRLEENTPAANLTIILRATSQLDSFPDAKAAFIRAAQSWESLIKSPITIYLDVDYGPTNFGQPWGTNVLGSTLSWSRDYPYSTVRGNLVGTASSSAETTLYNSLPSGSLPTDLSNASSTTVSDSIARAIGLLPATATSTDSASKIGFNSTIGPYDFDPSNGISAGQTDFEAVATHEIGHALGFTSRSGVTTPATPAIWDLFRFRSGTTLSTFPTAQRIMTASGSQYFYAGGPELALSTGGPNGDAAGGDGHQSSHWKDDGSLLANYIGIMDPTITSGRRQTITNNDLLALDSFGYQINAASTQTVQLSQSSYSVNENAKFATINVTRSGDTSTAATVKYSTSDATDVNFQCNPSTPGQPTGTASRKCDYHNTAGRLRFAPGETTKQIVLSVVDDVYVEGSETLTITLSNPTGASLGTPSGATVTITDNDTPGQANPIDGTAFYVRQLYVDLLSREPDPAGLQGWINRIDLCGQPGQAPPPCDRVTVGGDGFLRSGEFFDRQFFVIRLYRTALGRILRYDDVGDLAYVSGFLTDADLELNKQELVADIMSRSEFGNRYNGLNNSSYVDTLIQTAGATIPQSVRDGWVTALNNSTKSRGQVYRELSERVEVSNRYLHEAQVVSCYYGFFTRNPDGAYFSYLDRLDRGEINLGDLANAFINASEYRQRFGQ